MSKKIRMILMLTFLIQTTTFSVDFIQKKVDSNISLTNNTIPQMVTGEKQNKEAFNKLMSKLKKSIVDYNSKKENEYKLSFKYGLHPNSQDPNIQNFIFEIYADSYVKVGTLTMDINRTTGEMKNIDYKEVYIKTGYEPNSTRRKPKRNRKIIQDDTIYYYRRGGSGGGFSEMFDDIKENVGPFIVEDVLPALGEVAKEFTVEAIKAIFRYMEENS